MVNKYRITSTYVRNIKVILVAELMFKEDIWFLLLEITHVRILKPKLSMEKSVSAPKVSWIVSS